MLVVNLQVLKIIQDPHFVVWFMSGRVVEEVQNLHRGQHLKVLQYFVKIPELIVVNRQGLDMIEDIEDAVNVTNFVRMHKKMLYPEVLLESLQRSESIIV